MKIYQSCILFVISTVFSLSAFSQTNPSPRAVNFFEDFGTAGFSTLPAGFAGWNGLNGGTIDSQSDAASSIPSGNAIITSRTTTTTTGGSYGYALAGDASFYIQTSGNNGDGTNQLALGVNTSGCVTPNSVVLRYETSLVSSTPRTVGIVSQYRVGASGAWTTVVGVSFNSSSTPTAYSIASELPPAVLNQPNVQIRWASWRGTEAGNSSGADIDSVGVTCESVTASSANVGGRVQNTDGNGLAKVLVKISGGRLSEPIFVMTNPFGYFNFEVPVGQAYIVAVQSKQYGFSNPIQVVSVNDNVTDLSFVANEK